MLTRMLSHLGVDLGRPLQPPSFDNPKGFWENRFFQMANMDMLRNFGCDINGFDSENILKQTCQNLSVVAYPREFKDQTRKYIEQIFYGSHWGWKDPRSVITFPLWQRLLSDLGFNCIRPVVVLRHPESCVKSLMKRGDFNNLKLPVGLTQQEYIASLWKTYYQLIESYTTADVLVMMQEDLINEEEAENELKRCASYLGLSNIGVGPALATIDLKLVTHKKHADYDYHDAEEQGIYTKFLGRIKQQKEKFNKSDSSPSVLSYFKKNLVKGRYCIYVLSQENYSHSHAFDEHALSLHYAFQSLGYLAPIVHSEWEVSGTPIILGANMLPKFKGIKIPENSIIYNLEQVHEGSRWINREYINLLRHYRVWDYSQDNIIAFKDYGIEHVELCKVGVTPQLDNIRKYQLQDIDVLFYGTINSRREKIISELQNRGVKVKVLFKVYGHRRDKFIARSRIVINIHFYESKVMEIIRISYLLANNCFVVCEKGSDHKIEEYYKDGVVFSGYENLVDVCVKYLEAPEERERIAAKGKELISACKQEDYLKMVL